MAPFLVHCQSMFFFVRRILLPQQQHSKQSGLAVGVSGLAQLFPVRYPTLAPWPTHPELSESHQPCIPSSSEQRQALEGKLGVTVLGELPPREDVLAGLAKFQEEQHRQQELHNTVHTRFTPGGILRQEKPPPPISQRAGAVDSPLWQDDGPEATALPAREATDPRDIWRMWDKELGSSCSLFDDDDAMLIRKMSAESVLSVPSRAHGLASGLFQSGPAAAFIVQRLYAWGALCALYGPARDEPEGKPKPPSAYVQWVLSKGLRIKGVASAQEAADLVDTLTGRKLTIDEQSHEFFSQLYRLSSWKSIQPPALRPDGLLRRLCLQPGVSPSITKTVDAVIDTINKLQEAARSAVDQQGDAGGKGRYGVRSAPPPVPAPPTLAPEPLMLSPLQELPYLFALEAPEATGKLLQPEGMQPADGLAGRGRWRRGAKKKQHRRHETQAAQEALQASKMGQMLQSSYLDSYLGYQGSANIVLDRTRGVELWDRFMGRLAARLAWKKTSLLLNWLNGQLSFSEGTESRTTWLTLKTAQINDNPDLDDWTHEDCTRHLTMLCTQLRDPFSGKRGVRSLI